jgi:hypothetical protein|tara:strand:- start:925 stop:1266 length:342 start_codon:yes stop_codon:yes gene_type:complete
MYNVNPVKQTKMKNPMYLQPEQIESMKPLYGYVPTMDERSGTIEWYKENSNEVVYATPNWETEGICPIAYSNIETGDYTDVGTISLVGKSMEKQIEAYRDIVESVISGIVFQK